MIGEEVFAIECTDTQSTPVVSSEGSHKFVGVDCSQSLSGVTVKSAPAAMTKPYNEAGVGQTLFSITDLFDGYVNPACATCLLKHSSDNTEVSDPLVLALGDGPKWEITYFLNDQAGQSLDTFLECTF